MAMIYQIQFSRMLVIITMKNSSTTELIFYGDISYKIVETFEETCETPWETVGIS